MFWPMPPWLAGRTPSIAGSNPNHLADAVSHVLGSLPGCFQHLLVFVPGWTGLLK